jgi:hypothetical protein
MFKNHLQQLPSWSLQSGSLITLTVFCLILTPVFLNQFMPLNDYPFHFARINILADLDNPVYSEFYKSGSFLLPNMAMDMVAVPLAALVGAESASRIFVMLSLFVVLLGTILLHHAVHKRFSPWPLLAVVFVFNGIFRFGFLNYIFGVGIAFIAAALWLWMKPSLLRLVFALILSLLLIMLHFASFAVYAVIIGSFEIHAAYARWREIGPKASILSLSFSALPFLVALALFFIISPTAEVAGEGLSSRSFEFKTIGTIILGALYSILTGILWLDVLSYFLLIIIVCVLLFKKRMTFAPNALLALCIMTIAYILMPPAIMGSQFADVRLGPVIALLWVVTIDIKTGHKNYERCVAGVALVLSIFISIGTTKQWLGFNKEISTITRAFEQTEIGATIFSATTLPYPKLIADSKERRAVWSPPLKHVTSYAVLYGPKFVPMTFVDPTKQPLNVSDKYQIVKEFQTDNPKKTFTALELEQFILGINKQLASDSWPAFEHVYIFVLGFDRIKHNFDMSIIENSDKVIESNNSHILIKLK